MATIDFNNISEVKFNGTDITKIILDGSVVWEGVVYGTIRFNTFQMEVVVNDKTDLTNVPSGSTISYSNNVITITAPNGTILGTRTLSAKTTKATRTSTTGYTYTPTGITINKSTTLTDGQSYTLTKADIEYYYGNVCGIGSTQTKTASSYWLKFLIYDNDNNIGNIYNGSTLYLTGNGLSVPKDSVISASGNSLTIGDSTFVASVDNADAYAFIRWENVPSTMTAPTDINAIFGYYQTTSENISNQSVSITLGRIGTKCTASDGYINYSSSYPYRFSGTKTVSISGASNVSISSVSSSRTTAKYPYISSTISATYIKFAGSAWGSSSTLLSTSVTGTYSYTKTTKNLIEYTE